MRDFFEVINSVIELIPEENQDFIRDLIKVAKDAAYNPPECRSDDWMNGALVMEKYLEVEPDDNFGWKYNVYCKWMGI